MTIANHKGHAVDFFLLGCLQVTLNYVFDDINLLIEAVTHASVIHAVTCYQRLGAYAAALGASLLNWPHIYERFENHKFENAYPKRSYD